MYRLEVPLTSEQQLFILNFFLSNPQLQITEHYLHTHSPLDNLGHYMWEEIHEPNHISIHQNYQRNRYLTNDDINTWVSQELQERRDM
jgi:hypothetical protein